MDIRKVASDDSLIEIGRKAIEDLLVEMRDDRMSMPLHGNGFVIKERDGSPSDIIRMSTPMGLRVALNAICTYLDKLEETWNAKDEHLEERHGLK